MAHHAWRIMAILAAVCGSRVWPCWLAGDKGHGDCAMRNRADTLRCPLLFAPAQCSQVEPSWKPIVPHWQTEKRCLDSRTLSGEATLSEAWQRSGQHFLVQARLRPRP